jgi:hypothetical protein
VNPIQSGIIQTLALSRKLAAYFSLHPTRENEILMRVSLLLGTYCMALERLVLSPDFTDSLVRELIAILESADPDEAKLLEDTKKNLSYVFLRESREELRRSYGKRLVRALNMNVHLGRSLLRGRELEARGASDEEMQKAIDEPPDNIF